MLDSLSELFLVAAPTSSAMLSDLLKAADGASSAIESDSMKVWGLAERFYFRLLLADELIF